MYPCFSLSKIIKHEPLLAHVAPHALGHNTTATLFERGSLPHFVSTTQATKHTAGSGEFSFFWSLDTVIALVASSLGETIPRDLPFTVKKQLSCAWLSSVVFFTYLSDNRSVYSHTLSTERHPSMWRFSGNCCI